MQSLTKVAQHLKIVKARLYSTIDELVIEPKPIGNRKMLSPEQIELIRSSLYPESETDSETESKKVVFLGHAGGQAGARARMRTCARHAPGARACAAANGAVLSSQCSPAYAERAACACFSTDVFCQWCCTRARIASRSGVRVGFSTASIKVKRIFNAESRGRSRAKLHTT